MATRNFHFTCSCGRTFKRVNYAKRDFTKYRCPQFYREFTGTLPAMLRALEKHKTRWEFVPN